MSPGPGQTSREVTPTPTDKSDRSETSAAGGPTCPSVLSWSCSSQDVFCAAIESVYEKVVHWRQNVFNVPFAAHGAAFIEELADIINGFAEGTSVKQIAWKAITVACHVLLQKPTDRNSEPSFAEHLQQQ